MLKKFQWLKICMVVTLLLAGCSSSWRYAQPQPSDAVKGAAIGTVGGAALGAVTGIGVVKGAVIGGLSGGILGQYLENKKPLLQKIADNHVQIIAVGDGLTLLLPVDRFFAPDAPILNENYYSVLNQIAVLLRGLNKYVVKVSGHTDNTGWPQRNLALSRQQAQAVANYLWRQGIDASVLYATGYGDQRPIANNNTAQGRAMNRRIEITLRRITDDSEQ